jgi:pimeloyl-ACP methyl ester carboxylesterase
MWRYEVAEFVLVHGAWHGGWCWRKVANLLRRAGGEVHCPTLTGLGERAHLVGLLEPASIDLDLHIQDVVRLLEYQDLEQVILVGHAYAGMVITGVAERCPERLGHLVYVNGVVPEDGEAMVDKLMEVRGPQFAAWVRGCIDRKEWFLPPPTVPAEVECRWGISDPQDQAWVLSRVTPQPTAAFAQPLRVGSPVAKLVPRSFILSSESGFDSVAAMARKSGWAISHLDTGHDPMITTPQELAAILLRIGDRAPSA